MLSFFLTLSSVPFVILDLVMYISFSGSSCLYLFSSDRRRWRTRPCIWAHMKRERAAPCMRRPTMDTTCPNSTCAMKVRGRVDSKKPKTLCWHVHPEYRFFPKEQIGLNQFPSGFKSTCTQNMSCCNDKLATVVYGMSRTALTTWLCTRSPWNRFKKSLSYRINFI